MPSSCTTVAGSAPEFGELLGTGPALVVAGFRSGRTQGQVHRVGAEHVLVITVGEDRLDAAAARAEFVELRCEMRAPLHRRQRPAAEWGQHEHPLVTGCKIGILGVGSVAAVEVAAAADGVGKAT